MNDNKRNIHFFQNPTMAGLYSDMDQWQETHRKRFAPIDVQKDADQFCCIALTNPTEVIIHARESPRTPYYEVNAALMGRHVGLLVGNNP